MSRRLRITLLALAAALPMGAPQAASAQGARTHVLVVAGIGGEVAYTQAFYEWSARLADVVTGRWGLRPEDVTVLTERPDMDPDRIDGRSTKESIAAALRTIAGQAGAGDQVFVVLIGHGSYQGGEGRFSLPGPDITGAELSVMLSPLGSRRVVVANTASASGEFVKPLAAPNRIVIAATKSGMERNEARFGQYFVEAFAGESADTDKDGAVSLLEAFDFARAEVASAYDRDKKMLTEHAVLDDNGDGEGSLEPGVDNEDGKLARATFLGKGAALAGGPPPDASPALRALYAQKLEIEQRIDALRAVRATMEAQRYDAELENLLVELALKNQEIRKAEGGGP